MSAITPPQALAVARVLASDIIAGRIIARSILSSDIMTLARAVEHLTEQADTSAAKIALLEACLVEWPGEVDAMLRIAALEERVLQLQQALAKRSCPKPLTLAALEAFVRHEQP